MIETRKKAEVMLSFADGKEIQRRDRFSEGSDWENMRSEPDWNWEENEYRIKPKPLESWANVYPKGNTYHDTDNEARCERIGVEPIRVAVHMREVNDD